MILEFKTNRNKVNGSRKYIAIDTDARKYSTQSRSIIVDGIEITSSAYKEIIAKCNLYEFEKVDFIY